MESYDRKVEEELSRFANANKDPFYHPPPIHDYWQLKYIAPRIREVFGYDSIFKVRCATH